MLPTFVATLSDRELLVETARVVTSERHTTAQVIALVAEVDTRRLYLGEGYSSLFTYCTQALHLSEHAAYERITAARVSRRLPLVRERLLDGAVTLTTVGLLAPHLTADNCERLLEAARHRSKREVERLVASVDPQPDVAASIRRVPAAQPVVPASDAPLFSSPAVSVRPAHQSVDEQLPPAAPTRAPRATVAPLAPERYLIKVTVSGETHAKLRRAQDLLRHAVPTGDPAVILDRALTLLVGQLEKTRFAKSGKPRPHAKAAADARHVPAQVKRLVWERDSGRCAFVGAQGRCADTAFLEFHHIVPYAAGGATSLDNIALRCRSHNSYEAVKYFGAARSGPSSFRSAAPSIQTKGHGPDSSAAG